MRKKGRVPKRDQPLAVKIRKVTELTTLSELGEWAREDGHPNLSRWKLYQHYKVPYLSALQMETEAIRRTAGLGRDERLKAAKENLERNGILPPS